jgi:uncharacterized protein YfaS (alpha-2-macroglobulin family)
MFIKKLLTVIFLLTGLSLNIMAQTNNDYDKNWKKVESLEKKGLPKSALTEVLVIYNLAIKDNNDAQQIKSCMYQVKYRNMIEEDSQEKNIFFVDTLIEKAKYPAKNILQSMQAEMFWQYLQNNRWKFYNRTKLAEEKSKDISTWSIDKLYNVISKLYRASLSNTNILKSTKLGEFEPIINKGINTRQLRPTLFDFLAHRALEFFMNDESDLTKPAYRFTIKDAGAFADIDDFLKTPFKTKDTASLQHQALLILQDILQFHISDAKLDALLDADLIRLSFVNTYGVMEGKEKLYESALQHIENSFPENPASAQAMYLRAYIYYQRGLQFVPFTKTENQYELKRARELCDLASKKFPASEGGVNAQNLIKQIDVPALSLTSEKVNVPGQPFRTLVKYKNIKKLYLRIVKTSRDELKKLDRSEYEKLWKNYTDLKPLKSWSIDLPDPRDFQQHATEIKNDALNNGTYMMLASIDENFSLARNIIARQVFYVSNISYIHNNTNEYYVLHRDNGQPLSNTQVQVWQNEYNYQSHVYEDKKMERYTADKNGYFKIKESKEYRSVFLQLNYNSDELFLDDNNYTYYYNSYDEPIKPQTFIFTDRSIYRPGQMVYFKGIVVQRDNNAARSSVIPNFKTKVILKDANSQQSAELTVTTNEFGSYKGSFKLPEGMMNGQFSIIDSATASSNYFNVEEYKRPKFFVEIQKPKGSYRINDSIKVSGNAKGYAGNNIDGAKVKYRIVRKTRYPIWWDWWYFRGGNSRNEEVEITNGEMVTDNKGEFKISFKALPDESVDKKTQPVFNYEVSVDITDINGETRSSNTAVAVAYQALQLNIEMPEKMIADSLRILNVRSTNLNDIFEKTKVNVIIHKVQSPTKIFRSRYWDMPDQFMMSRDEYYNNFPYDIYKDEDVIQSWPLGDKAADITDSTNENAAFNMQHSTLSPGWYKIVAITKDKYGEEVRAEKYIQLTSGNMPLALGNEPISIDVKKQVAEPGEKIEYSISSGFDKIWLIHSLSKMDKSVTTGYYDLGKAARSFQSDVSASDRGGMSMSYAFVQHNRVYSGTENFSIPWSNKELNISYETFRDKLLPGSEEKWKLKISGNKGEKVAAEILAGMYDASLDQFKPHSWSSLNIWPGLYNTISWTSIGFSDAGSDEYNQNEYDYTAAEPKTYDRLDENFGYSWWYNRNTYAYDEVRRPMTKMMAPPPPPPPGSPLKEVVVTGAYGTKRIARSTSANVVDRDKDGVLDISDSTMLTEKNATGQSPEVKVRKNFNETAFFFPDLQTDAEGNVEFSFTMPEALTQWKLMTLAHTKDLSSIYSEKRIVTQKPLMVQPNAPRFMREGDRMEFSTKIVNLSDSEVTGTVQLELIDAVTNKPIDGWFKNIFPTQYFTVAAGQSEAVKFPIEIPFNFNSALTYRVKAITKANKKGETFSDGEEMAFPVLTNRMLVTESMPINLRGVNSRQFKFEKLLNSNSSNTLTNHALTVEYTSNPAWYAVQALPYLMEYPYECAEQTFNRYYANTLASFISRSMPKIKTVFDKWLTPQQGANGGDTAALLSNLQKNEELKSALLQEMPWVMEAQNENQQKKNIALLFDMARMSNEQDKALGKLKEMQSSNGGFVWFKGGADDRYMTQYIVTGIGHLKKLNALSDEAWLKLKPIIDKAIPYLDQKIKEDYDYLLRYKIKLKENNLGYTAIQYLYMRSFFTEYKIADASTTAYNYYRGQSQKYWLANSKYMQAMIGLSLYRTHDEEVPKAIIKSLKENSISNQELGMYWKEWSSGSGGYYWYQAPIESQAMMIEAFTDIDKDMNTIDDLKTWLLKQKQTQNWKTTKATAEACYALLLNGSNWLSEEKEVTINLGNTLIKSTDNATEAGTGYFKKRIEGDKVKPDMGNITVSVAPSTGKPLNPSTTSWGSVYWQYFEDLDKITPAETPLKLNKKLFIEKNSDKGPVLVAIGDGATLKVGDKVKVRIELRVDRDMEYVHMKDMRAACMEPVNVISQYKYQGGLGYYESTKDASTNFFFGWLARGTYVFEYTLFVTHTGNFSNGITSIQCMYAPEFTSHSEGIRVNVE